MRITRRFPSEAGDLIENCPPDVRSRMIAAFLICDDETWGTSPEILGAAYRWMNQLGRLTWRREPEQTVVSWSEHLN